MEKRKISRVAMGFIVLVVLVIVLMFTNSLRRSSRITLPEEGNSAEQTEENTAAGDDALTVIAVTPETVQTAIETLHRPAQYSRTIRVEQVWSGGSGSFETTVTVSGRWTRTDRTLAGRPDPPHHHRRGDHLYLVRQRERGLQRPGGGDHPGRRAGHPHL